jgi:HEAT repeat protein
MNPELARLVEKFPAPGGDRKLSNPDKQAMDDALAQLVKLGRAAVDGLVGALVDPSQGTDTQVRHALHALATYVSGQKNDQPRRDVAQALASTLDGDRSKEAKGFVIRQLQVCGGKEVVDALGKQLTDEDLCADAAAALLAIGASGEPFRKAIPQAKARKARLSLIQSLGTLRDNDAAAELRAAIKDDDGDIRQTSLWALANIAQPQDADLLIKAASANGYEGIQAKKSCLLLAERLFAAGHKDPAAKIYRHLGDDKQPEYIRDTAQRGLAAMNSRAGG